MVKIVEVASILIGHVMMGDEDDGGLLSNGESLYCPTLGPLSPILPHSPDHQSAPIKDLSDDPH